MSRNLNTSTAPFPAGLSGGGLLYLHAFTSIVSLFSIPSVELSGNNGTVESLWYEGGPGGMSKNASLYGC